MNTTLSPSLSLYPTYPIDDTVLIALSVPLVEHTLQPRLQMLSNGELMVLQRLVAELNREQEAFIANKHTEKGEAVAPWVGAPNEDILREECLSLSMVSNSSFLFAEYTRRGRKNDEDRGRRQRVVRAIGFSHWTHNGLFIIARFQRILSLKCITSRDFICAGILYDYELVALTIQTLL